MKVKAKWAVKVNGVWHRAGDVFRVDSTEGFAEAVEVLKDDPKPVKKKQGEPPAAEEAPAQETVPEPEAKAEPKPRTATRTRKKTIEK